jgi:hypothetical protein
MCEEKLGPNHPTTQKTARSLAFAYQTALNSPSGPNPYASGADTPLVGYASVAKAPGKLVPYGKRVVSKDDRSAVGTQQGALALREKIIDHTTQEVQTSVVPVLTKALKAETNSTNRMNLVRAIASLGPAGGKAVSVLTERLESSNDPSEVQVVLEALDELGPAACEAVPALEALSGKYSDRARSGKMADSQPKGVETSARFGSREAICLRKAIARLNSPRGRAGVEDEAGCFSVRAVCLANRTLRELAQKSKVEILVKTVASCTAGKEDGKCCSTEPAAVPRFVKMGKRAIHVIFARDGGSVEVILSDSLRRAGVSAEKMRKSLQERLRHRQYDKALDESIKLVSEIARAK